MRAGLELIRLRLRVRWETGRLSYGNSLLLNITGLTLHLISIASCNHGLGISHWIVRISHKLLRRTSWRDCVHGGREVPIIWLLIWLMAIVAVVVIWLLLLRRVSMLGRLVLVRPLRSLVIVLGVFRVSHGYKHLHSCYSY